jgi:zinc protease
MKPIVEKLSNDLTVVLCESQAAPVVAFQMWVGVGSADERKGEEGLAHVFEHMLFKGTKRRKVGEITRDVERAGGHINAWTSHDETVFYITLASRYWKQGLDILGDAIQHPAIDENELERELQVILEEIRMGKDTPERVVTEKLFKASFKKHPYGRPVIGFNHTVKAFTRKKVMDFHSRWYVPSNMVFVVSGDFDKDIMLKEVKKTFQRFDRKKTPPRSARVREPGQRSMRITCGAQPISEAHLAIGFPIPQLEHKDIPALDLLAAVLGQGASSRLETIIRRELSLVSGIRSMAYTPKDSGMFAIFATVPPHNLEKATSAILKELFKLTKESVTLAEIDKGRILLESDKVYSEETVDGTARKAGFQGLHTGDLEFEKRYMGALFSQEPEDLVEIARRYFLKSVANVAVIVPDPDHQNPRHRVPWISGRGDQRTIDATKLKKLIHTCMDTIDKPEKKSSRTAKRHRTMVRELSSGDILIVREEPSTRLVAARVAFLGGLRYEPAKQSGLGALLACTMTRGTENLSAQEVAGTMDGLACSMGGFTGRNTHGIRGEFLKRNFKNGFELMSQCLRRPVFPDVEVKREKQLLIEEIRANDHNPGYKVFQLFHQTLFGKHPYARQIGGTVETVKALSSNMLTRYLKNTTGPGSMVLAIAGGTDIDEATALAERYLVDRGTPIPKHKAPNPWKPPVKIKQVRQGMNREQSHVIVGFPGTTITSDDRFALEVLTEILGGHGGRLFAGVREQRGLAYAVTAMSLEGMEPGFIALYAGTSPGLEMQVIEAMTSEVKQIRDKGPTAEEMRRVKTHLIGSKAIAWQRVSTQAASLALDYIYGNGYGCAEDYPKRIDSISRKAVQEIALKYLDTVKPIIVCVGPNAEKLSFT